MLILPQIKELQRADLIDQVGNGSNTLQSGTWRNISGTFTDINNDSSTIYCNNFINVTLTVKSASSTNYSSVPNWGSLKPYIGQLAYNSFSTNSLGTQSTYSITSGVCSVLAVHSFAIGESVYVDFSTGGATAQSGYYNLTENRVLTSCTYQTYTSNYGTITTSSDNNMVVGEEFEIQFGGAGSIHNGTYRVWSINSSTSFNFLFPFLQNNSTAYSGSGTLYSLNKGFSFNLAISNASGNCSYRIYLDNTLYLRKGNNGQHGQGGGGQGGQGSGGGGGGGGGGTMPTLPFLPGNPPGLPGNNGQPGTGGSNGSAGNYNGAGGSGGAGASLINFNYRRGGYGGAGWYLNYGDSAYGGWEGVTPSHNGGNSTYVGGGPAPAPYGQGGTGYTSGGSGGEGGTGGLWGSWGFSAATGGGGGGQGGPGGTGTSGGTASNGSAGTNPSKSLYLLVDNRITSSSITVQSNTADMPTNPSSGTKYPNNSTPEVGGQGGQGGQGSRGNVSRIVIANRYQTYNNVTLSIPSQIAGNNGEQISSGGTGGIGGAGGGAGTGGGENGGWGTKGGDGVWGFGGYKGQRGHGGSALLFTPPTNKIYF